MSRRIVFSLVLYQHRIIDFLPLLHSVSSLAYHRFDYSVALAVYDASPASFPAVSVDEIAESIPAVNLIYHKARNIGFGSANNYNFKSSCLSGSDIFVVANPDISFVSHEITPLFDWLWESAGRVSCVAPLIANSCGDIQFSAKRNPTLLSLLLGRFGFLRRFNRFLEYDSWHRNLTSDYASQVITSPYLSGCFLVIPCHYYLLVGGFCERFFLHLEDADLVRRLSGVGLSLHNPIARVTHLWARGSHSSLFQMYWLSRSLILYWSIWGLSFA